MQIKANPGIKEMKNLFNIQFVGEVKAKKNSINFTYKDFNVELKKKIAGFSINLIVNIEQNGITIRRSKKPITEADKNFWIILKSLHYSDRANEADVLNSNFSSLIHEQEKQAQQNEQ